MTNPTGALPPNLKHIHQETDDVIRWITNYGPMYDEIQRVLKEHVQNEGLDPDYVYARSLGMCFDKKTNNEYVTTVNVGVYNTVRKEWCTHGSVHYNPDGWSYGLKFSPAGNIFSVFHWIVDHQGYHYTKYNIDSVMKATVKQELKHLTQSASFFQKPTVLQKLKHLTKAVMF